MRICLMRTVRASDFFLSSLWPVEAPFSLFLVAANVLQREGSTRDQAPRPADSGKIRQDDEADPAADAQGLRHARLFLRGGAGRGVAYIRDGRTFCPLILKDGRTGEQWRTHCTALILRNLR